jgi:hypothetical protein
LLLGCYSWNRLKRTAPKNSVSKRRGLGGLPSAPLVMRSVALVTVIATTRNGRAWAELLVCGSGPPPPEPCSLLTCALALCAGYPPRVRPPQLVRRVTSRGVAAGRCYRRCIPEGIRCDHTSRCRPALGPARSCFRCLRWSVLTSTPGVCVGAPSVELGRLHIFNFNFNFTGRELVVRDSTSRCLIRIRRYIGSPLLVEPPDRVKTTVSSQP